MHTLLYIYIYERQTDHPQMHLLYHKQWKVIEVKITV